MTTNKRTRPITRTHDNIIDQVVDGDDIDGRGRDGVKRLSAMFPRSPSIQSVKSLLGSLGARSKSI